MNHIWNQFASYIAESAEVRNDVNVEQIKTSLLANLLFNNLNKVRFANENKADMEDTGMLTIIFATSSSRNVKGYIKDYKIRRINQGNIVTVKGNQATDKTCYLLEGTYENLTAYIPKENVIMTTYTLGQFLLKDQVLLAHLINQTRDDLIITNDTLVYVEGHESTKMLSKRLLVSTLSNQAEEGLKKQIRDNIIRIADNRVNIEKANEHIIKLQKEIAEVQENIIFAKGGDVIADEIFALTDRNKNIRSVISRRSGDNNTELVITTEPIELTKYDNDRLERFLNRGGWQNNGPFRRVLKLLVSGKAKVFFSSYEIIITIPARGGLNWKLIPLTPNKRNPHQGIGCYGSYGNHLSNAADKRNFTVLIILLLEFLSSITFGDGGATDLPTQCYALNEKGERFYG